MRVLSYNPTGNSFPIIVEHKGQRLFVKLRAGMSGEYSLLSEWFGNRMGHLIDMCTQRPAFINIPKNIVFDNIHVEVQELVLKSVGVNVAFPYQENIVETNELDLLSEQKANAIFLLDLLMINMDRTIENTNLLKIENHIISTDYESCLIFQDILNGGEVLQNPTILKCFKANPLYRELSESAVTQFLTQVQSINFADLFEGVPDSVLDIRTKQAVLLALEKRRKEDWFIPLLMEKLKDVRVESPAERQTLIDQNRARFRANFDKRLN